MCELKRILHYLFIYLFLASFGPAAGHFRVVWQWEVLFCFFCFHEFHRLVLGFHRVSESLWVGFCTIFQALFCGSWSTGPGLKLFFVCCLILPLVLWFMPVGAVSRRHIAKQWTQNWKKDGVVFFSPSSILWLFLLIFWQVLFAFVKLWPHQP